MYHLVFKGGPQHDSKHTLHEHETTSGCVRFRTLNDNTLFSIMEIGIKPEQCIARQTNRIERVCPVYVCSVYVCPVCPVYVCPVYVCPVYVCPVYVCPVYACSGWSSSLYSMLCGDRGRLSAVRCATCSSPQQCLCVCA